MTTSNNNIAANTVADTIVAFHIGRGGHYHNSGHKTFIGEKEIGDFNDLFIAFENEYAVYRKIAGRKNIESLLDDVRDDRDNLELKAAFERRTGLSLGELVYTDGNGNHVGLTLAEEATGVGTINIDNDYDTTYTCKLSDCNQNELELIANSGHWNDAVVDYALENLD